ncbi:hypothetical protein D1007_35463 [Hordeum vulgare]|nr:hypothetical protein D1007_35463 [Hordeum vulgare]
MCDWLVDIYDPPSREFVIPRPRRLPLDEEFVFFMLGVPRGGFKVPYKVNNKIEEVLFPRFFPDESSMPNKTILATSLGAVETHGEAKLEDVKIMNWYKFIGDFLHDAFANKMNEKAAAYT